MSLSDSAGKWVSIIVGGLVILTAIGVGVEWRIRVNVAAQLTDAKPAVVETLEDKVDILTNDLGHFTTTLNETRTDLNALRSVIERDLRCRAGGAC